MPKNLPTLGQMMLKNKYPNAYEEVSWFDMLLPRVRNLRYFLSDEEIVTKLVNAHEATSEQVFLCLKAATILDGER